MGGRFIGIGGLQQEVSAEVRANFRWELTAAVFGGIATGVVGNYLFVVARRLGASPLLLSVIMAGSFLGILLSIAAPYLLEAAQPARRVAVLLAAAQLVWLGAPFVDTPAVFVALTLAYFVLLGLPGPIHARIIQGAYPRRVRGRLMAGVRIIATLAALVTAPVAGLILDAVGHGTPFAVAGVIGAVGALAFARLRVLRPHVAGRPPPWRLVQAALRNRSFRNFAIAYNVHGVGGLLMFLVIPIVLVDDFDAPFSTVGVLTLAQGLASVVGFSLWGRLSDRYSGPVVSVSSTSLSIVSGAILIVAIVTGSVWLLAAAFLMRGLQIAGYDIGWLTSVTAMARPEETSALTTTFLVAVGIRGLIVPFIGTVLIEAIGSVGTLAVTIGIAAVGSGLMVRVARGFMPIPDDPDPA